MREGAAPPAAAVDTRRALPERLDERDVRAHRHHDRPHVHAGEEGCGRAHKEGEPGRTRVCVSRTGRGPRCCRRARSAAGSRAWSAATRRRSGRAAARGVAILVRAGQVGHDALELDALRLFTLRRVAKRVPGEAALMPVSTLRWTDGDGPRGRAEHGFEVCGWRRRASGSACGAALLPGPEGGEHHDGHGRPSSRRATASFDVGDGEEGTPAASSRRHRQRAMAVGVRLHHRHDGDGTALQRAVVRGQAVESMRAPGLR